LLSWQTATAETCAVANLSRASFLEILKTGKSTKSSAVPSVA
jgi:hypothetical protein